MMTTKTASVLTFLNIFSAFGILCPLANGGKRGNDIRVCVREVKEGREGEAGREDERDRDRE